MWRLAPSSGGSFILSLLVCAVGIVNAQLMAVTERFREIGTMKCLGALDRFVLRLFILEAGMQGLQDPRPERWSVPSLRWAGG